MATMQVTIQGRRAKTPRRTAASALGRVACATALALAMAIHSIGYASQTVQFGYDSQGRLSTVTNSDTTTNTFLYENASFPNALTGLLDENTSRFATWGYDTQGRGTSTSEAGGAGSTTLNYNTDGSVTVTDALFAVRVFTFGRYGDLNSVTGISGSRCPTCTEQKATTYDSAGWVSSRFDYNNVLTCYANDSARGLELVRVEGFATSITTCPANLATYVPTAGTRERKITTTWHATFRLPLTVTEQNRTTAYTYDASGNMLTRTVTDTSVTPNVSRTWTYTYDSYGRMLTADGPRTDVLDKTTYAYYTCTTGSQCGQLNTITNAAGQVTTYNSYNPQGQPTQITDPKNVVTTLAYDARSRVTDRCVNGVLPACSGGQLTHFDYWPTGLLKQATLPDSSNVQYTYDAAHRLTQIADGLGNRVSYSLDAMGNRTGESAYDPSNVLSRTKSRVYNALSQLYQEIGAAGTAAVTTTFVYDGNGNQTSIQAPISRNTTNAFDELNRLKQVTDPALGNTYIGYDANDNLTSVQDPRNLTTSYTYTGFGDVKTLVSPDTGTTTNVYDSGGNLATSTDSRSAISAYTYDTLNRVASVAYKVGSTADQTITYTYDAGTNGKGRLTGASDSSHSMGWSYDAYGRVISKSQTIGTVTKAVGYAYTNGNLTTVTTPSGQTVTFTYANNRVSSISINGATLLSSVTYEPFGPPRGWTWGNATSEVRLHNTDGNTSQVSGTESVFFGFDNAFRITSATNASNSALSWTYGYDALDRLISASKTGATYGWTFDADGNRLTQTGTAAGTYTISGTSNRLSSITGTPARTYTYDNAGNALTFGTVTNTYNNRGRMKTAKVGSSTTTYVYNAIGQRVRKSGGPAGTVLYWYDEAGHLLGEYNSTGGLVQETVWLGDIPVATIRPGTPAVVWYVHADQLNAPRMVTRPSDNKAAWRWDADPYGTAAPNQNPQSLGTFVYNLRYPGQYYDSETGSYYNYFRDYDPAVGRYVESDPAGLQGGLNTYSYVFGSPVSGSDPFGLSPCTIDLQQLIQNAKQGALDPATHLPRTTSSHDCARTVRNDLKNAGGPTLPPLGLHGTPTPGAWGPTLVNSGCYELVKNSSGYVPQLGDIAIAVGTGTSHISIYDGSGWDADISKPNAVPNSGGPYAGAMVTYYRYTGQR
jgi:RHS repeat-associated protein